MTSPTTTTTEATTATTVLPTWDPVAQIYVNGVLPETVPIHDLLSSSHGSLRIFGYGSLCWHPGPGALATATRTTGRVHGYRRCWAQKSTDHRGTPSFPGLVCTLLTDTELRQFRVRQRRRDASRMKDTKEEEEESITEGVIYLVPPERVVECLAELDFREKGGYARDVVTVIEDETNEPVQALLYRGTPDNPSLWPRAWNDLSFAAAVLATAKGPSGEGSFYLRQLDEFLLDTAASPKTLEQFDDTFVLTEKVNALLRHNCQLEFLVGGGSNQHNQLLLASDENAAELVRGQEAHELKEIVFCALKQQHENGDWVHDKVKKVLAGGGHSGLLTEQGRLFLFGWNENGQLGSSGLDTNADDSSTVPLPVCTELQNILVEDASLGHFHTLVIEKNTGRVFAFGNNCRGQVDGVTLCDKITDPVTPKQLMNDSIIHVAAGLFHSAAVTRAGELVTFGGGQVSQLHDDPKSSKNDHGQEQICHGRWQPTDGAAVVKVACGRRHTVALDDQGRLWTFGDNKYGQLGRETRDTNQDASPLQVKITNSDLVIFDDVHCGWSHTVGRGRTAAGEIVAYGWGRNDKGQLGTGTTDHIVRPQMLFSSIPNIQSVACGSEFTIVADADHGIWSCGWNEHGNLGSGTQQDQLEPIQAKGAQIVKAPHYPDKFRLSIGAGGAHFLAMKCL